MFTTTSTRNVRKGGKAIRNNKLLDACINGNGDLFGQIKLMSRSSPVVPASMDGEKSNSIAKRFQNIYSKLYNSNDDGDKIL